MGPDAFDYVLPREQIAQSPAPQRGDARLMVVPPTGAGEPVHTQARALPEHVPADALVVINRSRVVPARIWGERADGRVFELLIAAPAPGMGPGTELSAWVRGGRALSPGDVLELGQGLVRVRALPRDPDSGRARNFIIEQGELLPALEHAGALPLPPYITREQGPSAEDRARYQTVYAGPPGSVAAPTAGLHLDAETLGRLDTVAVTLHVGPGTFVPMDVADVRDHRVDAERIEIDEAAAQRLREAQAHGRPILAVGTTVVRALESVAALHGGVIVPFAGTTDLVITPGFEFKAVTGLLTNFHLPRSSLLMLVCAFAGTDRVLGAYAEAVAAGYRFYSFGDCMLVGRDA